MTDDNRPDIDLAYRLASLGASHQTIAAALGITLQELKSSDIFSQEIFRAVETGRAKGCADALQALHTLACSGKSVDAIKYYLSVQSPDYRVDKAAVEINNNTLALPSAAEALRILRADPAIRSLHIDSGDSDNGA